MEDSADIQIKPGSSNMNKRSLAHGKSKGKIKSKKTETEVIHRASPRFPCVMGHTKGESHGKNCSVCELQSKKPGLFGTKKIQNEDLFKCDKPMPFMTFIDYLLPESPDLDGCEMILRFPESVFFDDKGKPHFLALTDKNDRKLKSQTHQRYLGLQTMEQFLRQEIKRRKLEEK